MLPQYNYGQMLQFDGMQKRWIGFHIPEIYFNNRVCVLMECYDQSSVHWHRPVQL